MKKIAPMKMLYGITSLVLLGMLYAPTVSADVVDDAYAQVYDHMTTTVAEGGISQADADVFLAFAQERIRTLYENGLTHIVDFDVETLMQVITESEFVGIATNFVTPDGEISPEESRGAFTGLPTEEAGENVEVQGSYGQNNLLDTAGRELNDQQGSVGEMSQGEVTTPATSAFAEGVHQEGMADVVQEKEPTAGIVLPAYGAESQRTEGGSARLIKSIKDIFGLQKTSDTLTETSCFDYYKFGSVSVDLETKAKRFISGTPVVFSGVIINNNNYPIVNGALYVKVFRKRDDALTKNPNGPHLVDRFFVLDRIDLPARESLPVTFTWNIPEYAQSGEYQLATFFSSSQKYNLSGLSFTDDVTGNSVDFSVFAERETGVYFDKDSVQVNGDTYYFAAFPPRIPADTAVDIVATIKNTTDNKEVAEIKWNLYQWDSLTHTNLVHSETSTYLIPAQGSADISFQTNESAHPVYLAVGELTWKDTHSLIFVRFVKEGSERLRINFPAVTTYPLRKGEEAELFSCVHNTAFGSADGELVLTLTDMDGGVIHRATYRGEVRGDMMGVVDAFTPKRSYENFVLKAELFQEGTRVDETHLEYFCENFKGRTCNTSASSAGGFVRSMQEKISNTFSPQGGVSMALIVLLIGLITLFGLGALIGGALWYKRSTYDK